LIWGVSEIVGVAAFVLAVAGSIGRVIWRQAADSQTLYRVESEVREIQLRKEVHAEQLGKNTTELAVLKESLRNIDKKLDALMEKIK
jgi:hypothetical protein